MSENPWDEAFASCDNCLGPVPSVGSWVTFDNGFVSVFCSEECVVQRRALGVDS